MTAGSGATATPDTLRHAVLRLACVCVCVGVCLQLWATVAHTFSPGAGSISTRASVYYATALAPFDKVGTAGLSEALVRETQGVVRCSPEAGLSVLSQCACVLCAFCVCMAVQAIDAGHVTLERPAHTRQPSNRWQVSVGGLAWVWV